MKKDLNLTMKAGGVSCFHLNTKGRSYGKSSVSNSKCIKLIGILAGLMQQRRQIECFLCKEHRIYNQIIWLLSPTEAG